MGVTIFHNPKCGTSRNVLAALQDAGMNPVVVDYQKTGWTKPQLKSLLAAMQATPRDVLRINGTPAEELGLTDPKVSDEALLDAMVVHPILVQRPIVQTDTRTMMVRPSEKVAELIGGK